MKNKETLEEAKLRQLFKNRSNCYADTEDVVQAMDEDCFIKTINEWQQKQDKNKYSEEELLKAQQAILSNIRDALQNDNYIIECIENLKINKI